MVIGQGQAPRPGNQEMREGHGLTRLKSICYSLLRMPLLFSRLLDPDPPFRMSQLLLNAFSDFAGKQVSPFVLCEPLARFLEEF